MGYRYDQGDIIEVQHEWEDEPRVCVVLSDYGERINVDQGDVHERSAVKQILHTMTDVDYFIFRQEQILAGIPEEFQGVISHKAYEDQHSGGYGEVLNEVMSLVEAFKGPIEKYTARIKKG